MEPAVRRPALTLALENEAPPATLPGHVLEAQEAGVHPEALAPLPHTVHVARAHLGHEGHCRGHRGHQGSFPQVPPRPRGAEQSPLTPAGKLPLHLHVEIRGLRWIREPVRAPPRSGGQWAWAAPFWEPSPSSGPEAVPWPCMPPSPPSPPPRKGWAKWCPQKAFSNQTVRSEGQSPPGCGGPLKEHLAVLDPRSLNYKWSTRTRSGPAP